MKKNATTRGTVPSRNVAIRQTKNLNKKVRKKKKNTGTKGMAALTVVLLLGLTATVLYTQFYKAEVDRFFAKKYTVTDVNGVEIKYTEEELKEAVTSDKFYEGIRVDGVDVSEKTLPEAMEMFKSTREKTIDEMVDIKFQVGDEQVPMSTEGMTVSSNIDEVLTEAFNYAKTSPLEGVDGLLSRYRQIMALKKTPKEYSSEFTIGYGDVTSVVHEALDGYNYAPKDAKATGFNVDTLTFRFEDAVNGQFVNTDKAIAAVNDALIKENYKTVIPVELSAIEPKVTADSLNSKLGKVSSNSSKTTDKPARNHNIWLVCKALDGIVLQPGEQFDFNKCVGQRTEAKGYQMAAGITNGASELQLGGGICQANTMLYHSVMEADLQVDVRVAHSWPSDYVDPGTDATVSWEDPDFKFTNNTDYPVAIHAYYGDRWVTVEIYGRQLPEGQKIKFFGGGYLVDEEPTRVNYKADSSLPVGTMERVRSAHNHKIAVAYKVTYDANGKEIARKELKTEYKLIEAEYRVGTKGPDGTIYKMDPKTGAVSPP